MGHTLLRGYTDLDATSTSIIYTSDEFAGLHGAFAVMAALNARRRTGEGQLIEIAQAECGMAMLAEAVLDYSLNGRVHQTVGNRDIHSAIQGVYRCLGDDNWIAITIRDDAGWAGLCDAMARPELSTGERFATSTARLANHDEVDRIVAAWTVEHDARALLWALQGRGVTAGPVMSARDVYDDPHVAERAFFETVHHPDTGTYPWPGMPFKLSETPLSVRRPPRGLGEDNEYVYKTLLGFSDEEYAEFEREGHIGTEFDPEIT